MVVLAGWVFSYERGTPVGLLCVLAMQVSIRNRRIRLWCRFRLIYMAVLAFL